ncbi:hypothetical protein FRC06_000320 [Ceratobasidium sp. 370]|nr:hypothetical protein FRC06_000320 [Ceratobasidium sp. 370]
MAYEAFPAEAEGHQYIGDVETNGYIDQHINHQYVDNINRYFDDDLFVDDVLDRDDALSEGDYPYFWDNTCPNDNPDLNVDNGVATYDDGPGDIPVFATYDPDEVESPGEPYVDDDTDAGGCLEAYPLTVGYDPCVEDGSEAYENQADERDWTGDWDGVETLNDDEVYEHDAYDDDLDDGYQSYDVDDDVYDVYGDEF